MSRPSSFYVTLLDTLAIEGRPQSPSSDVNANTSDVISSVVCSVLTSAYLSSFCSPSRVSLAVSTLLYNDRPFETRQSWPHKGLWPRTYPSSSFSTPAKKLIRAATETVFGSVSADTCPKNTGDKQACIFRVLSSASKTEGLTSSSWTPSMPIKRAVSLMSLFLLVNFLLKLPFML